MPDKGRGTAADGTFGDLTLTATWDESAENPTTLADAQSGVAKTYSLTGGVYTIGVGIPSAGTVRFTLDPVKNSMENDSNVTYTVRYIYNAEDTMTARPATARRQCSMRLPRRISPISPLRMRR